MDVRNANQDSAWAGSCHRMRDRMHKRLGQILVTAAIACLSQWGGLAQRAEAQTLPANADKTCVVTPAQFAGWFANNTITPNGVVNPANSVTFVPSSNCAFYQWSEQMFLWLSSPAPAGYGGTGRIFDSPTFFDVSPPDAKGNRTFIPHTAGVLTARPMAVRAAKVGPHGLQVIFDKAGRMLEVQPAKRAPNGQQLILNAQGREVEIERATIANDKVTFLDKTGKPIASPKPILEPRLVKGITPEDFALKPRRNLQAAAHSVKTNPSLIVQKFMIGGLPIFIDPFGNLDPVEQGQADGSVLMTQKGSLVYFALAVNDVYAYWLTGAKTSAITPFPTVFPTTQPQLTAIVNYAATRKVTFPDPNALAIEVKTSWVDAATVTNPSSYVTMNAIIPTYTSNANGTLWTLSSSRPATLAMVGMHVVGSAAGHPELIWATFEHVGNAPLGTYTYNSGGVSQTVNQSTAGTWLFAANGAAAPFNLAHMSISATNSQNIAANSASPPALPPPFTITASNTLRQKPFGGATDLIPFNQTNATATSANTDVISINNSIRGMLQGSDIRGNYIMSGATWTFGGAAPTFTTATPPANNSNQVGTSYLTNSSLETYDQGTGTTSVNATNCFSCHNDPNGTLAPNVQDGLTHIFFPLQPLP